MSDEILTPVCPICSQPPIWVLGEGRQCWCGNENCTTLTWDATKTLDENLLDARSIKLPGSAGDTGEE